MGKPELILRRGSHTLDLNDQIRYWLAQDFVPPAMQISTQFATGSSANLYGGSTVTSWKAFDRSLSFTVRLDGSSGYDIQDLIRALTYVLNHDISGETLYLEYRSNGDVPQPLWGQIGTPARYEVVHGDCALEDGYLIGVRRNEDVNVTITLLVKPFMLGKQQRICTATGGILEDTIGTEDGWSRGLMVPEATTNKFTNPVFGHATFGNGWTASANITATANTDPEYVLFGATSAKLTCNGGTNLYYQTLTLTAVTYTLSFYVKRLDKQAVTGAVVAATFDGSGEVVSITSVGNGWHRCSFSGTASAAATSYGVVVAAGHSVFVDGFQVEALAYATPLAYGDMLGCAWAGTAHASASTRTAASCKLPIATDTFNNAQGSARFVVRFDVPNTHANSMYFFDTRDGSNADSILAQYEATTDKFYLYTTANAAASSAKTFSAGATYVLHFVWGAAAMKIYVNGVEDGTDDYVYATPGSNVFIGTDYVVGNPMAGRFSAVTFFDVPLTAAQVLADYNDIAPLVALAERVECVPYLWTVGGDNVLALTANHQPLGIVAGVPGTVPAITEIRGVLSDSFSIIKSVVMSNLPANIYIKPSNFFYDMSGTATAGDYGGQHLQTSLNSSTPISLVGILALTLDANVVRHLYGVEYCIYSLIKAASATSFSIYARSYSGGAFWSEAKTITPATSYRMFRTNTSIIADVSRKFSDLTPQPTLLFLYASIPTGALAVDIDYYIFMPRPMVVLSGAFDFTGFLVKNGEAYYLGSDSIYSGMNSIGDAINFYPSMYNHFQIYLGGNGDFNPLITYTSTFSEIYLTPRWALL